MSQDRSSAGWAMAYSDWDHGVLSRHRCPLHLSRLPDMDLCRGLDQSGPPTPPLLIHPYPCSPIVILLCLSSPCHGITASCISDTQQLVPALSKECAERLEPEWDRQSLTKARAAQCTPPIDWRSPGNDHADCCQGYAKRLEPGCAGHARAGHKWAVRIPGCGAAQQ